MTRKDERTPDGVGARLKREARNYPRVTVTAEALDAPIEPCILEIIDALILYDTPLLDQRFQETIRMHPDPHIRRLLGALPTRVARGSRLTRRAGVLWEGAGPLSPEFKHNAERFLLEAFLESVEAQIRLKRFLAAQAPTEAVRQLIEEAIGIHGELTIALRRAIDRLGPEHATDVDALFTRSIPEGDLRRRVEVAIQAAAAKGKHARRIVVSPLTLRRLREQGLLANGETTIAGVPVQVDLGWTGASFAVLTGDSFPLAELPADAASE